MHPDYLKLTEKELKIRAKKAKKLLNPCRLCPRECNINRLEKSNGFCEMGKNPVISSYNLHFGEEAPLVGREGSGTIFFTSCNLACVYCQNYDISHLKQGKEVSMEKLAMMMTELQDRGANNINFVSPTIWVPQIIEALIMARDQGLNIPLVYNSGGYDNVKTLKLLDGMIDIYMPDFKYSDSGLAKKYSEVDNYFSVAKEAIKEMHRQTGDLIINKHDLAEKGLLVRHLILPNNIAGTEKVMEFLALISKDTYINIMDQYRPAYKASKYQELNRGITQKEYKKAIEIAKEKGLYRFDGKQSRILFF